MFCVNRLCFKLSFDNAGHSLGFFFPKNQSPLNDTTTFFKLYVCVRYFNLFKLFTYLSTLIGFTDARHAFVTNPLNEFSFQNLFLNSFYQFQRNQITRELQRELWKNLKRSAGMDAGKKIPKSMSVWFRF